jgi:uncharacterized protein (UPF0262 family)
MTQDKNIHRIQHLTLDTQSFVAASTEIELEKHRAVSDLLCENKFVLQTNPAAQGPYKLTVSLREERLVLDVFCTMTGHQEEILILLSPLRRHIQDYILLCDNYYKTVKDGNIHKLEILDEGRRSIHDEGAEMLAEGLENKVILDKSTARRLFSLIYVLHMRSPIKNFQQHL